MRGHEEIQKLVKERHSGVEICPISNLQTKAVKRPEEYPIKEFLNAGLLVSVNTDNRTVSSTSMTKELEFIQSMYGVSDEEILLMMRNASETAFASEELKHRLYKKLDVI